MFGIYRYALATLVAVSHLWFGRLPWGGAYAVFSFYLLSGYLMTLVLTETYGFSAHGVARYLSNRALRIYPPYLLCVALALGLFMAVPGAVRSVIPYYVVASSLGDTMKNLFLVGLTVDTHAKWIPQAWSLNVELAFYVAMAALARHWAIGVLWFLASLVHLGRVLAIDPLAPEHFFPLAAASLPFSTGSLLYHARHLLPAFSPRRTTVAAALYGINVLLAGTLWSNVWVQGFYASLSASVLLTACLMVADGRAHPAVRRVDGVLGDLAYPLYLCHWHVGAFVWWLWPACRRPRGLFFVVSIGLATLVAWGIHRSIETPLAALRTRLRTS